MSASARILLVAADPDDAALAAIVLRHAMQDAEILEAGDALEFAEHLAGSAFSVAVVDGDLAWAEGPAVIEAIRRRHPDCITVLFGDAPPEGAGIDTCVPRSSRGFLDLPGAIRGVLDRKRGAGEADVGLAAYDRLIEQLPVGIFSMEMSGALTRANDATVSVLGFDDEGALVGRQLPDLLADVDVRMRCRALLARGQGRKDLQTVMRRADGGTARVSLSFWPVPAVGAEAQTFEGVLWDLSGLAALGGPGGMGTAELEQLTSAVSHDLQDPLQLIAQYAQLLVERHGKRLDEDALRLLGRVQESAARMQTMIDGILEYSRVSAAGRPFQVVSLTESVSEAIKNLEASMSESGAEVDFHDLPSVVAEPRQLIQLFQNLIGNAVKFHAKEPPRVTIRCEERPDDWLISVADNGLGIDSRSAEHIFDMFQRLHAASEIPGRGIGLAICKRIAECHGGRIWVESRPGGGSTFFVTLSKQLPGDRPGRETDARRAG